AAAEQHGRAPPFVDGERAERTPGRTSRQSLPDAAGTGPELRTVAEPAERETATSAQVAGDRRASEMQRSVRRGSDTPAQSVPGPEGARMGVADPAAVDPADACRAVPEPRDLARCRRRRRRHDLLHLRSVPGPRAVIERLAPGAPRERHLATPRVEPA